MGKIEYLPLGSVVLLKGGIKKLMIISRGLTVNMRGEQLFFDYGGVPYTEGLTGEQLAYFNHDAVTRILFKGFCDDDDRLMVDNINEYVDEKKPKKGNPQAWQETEG